MKSSKSLDLFKLDVGRYPSDAEGLRAWVERTYHGPGLDRAIPEEGVAQRPLGCWLSVQEPWPQWRAPMCSLWALMAKPGGDGENADVYN